jgi:hypothetical protein
MLSFPFRSRVGHKLQNAAIRMQDRKRILEIGLLFTIYSYSLPCFIQTKDGSFKLSFFNLGVIAHVIINLIAR